MQILLFLPPPIEKIRPLRGTLNAARGFDDDVDQDLEREMTSTHKKGLTFQYKYSISDVAPADGGTRVNIFYLRTSLVSFVLCNNGEETSAYKI